MMCPFCIAQDDERHKTEVLETRMYLDPETDMEYVERKRNCLNCETRFTTIERMVEDD